MIPDELLDRLHRLSRGDKLRVIQLLASDLATEEEAYLTAGASYEVWSPFDAPEAASALLRMLEEASSQDG
jgi:CheY-like chemotaxis protein